MLLDGLASGQAMAPETVALPDALHLLMLSRLNLPMNAEMAVSLGLADSLMVAASTATPPPLRIAAAEKLLRAGVLPTDLFGEILDLTTFSAGDLSVAPALARTEPLMQALARLGAALRMTGNPEQRAATHSHRARDRGDRGLAATGGAALWGRCGRNRARTGLGQLV